MPDFAIKFPCDFPIKVMGRDEPAFHDAVTAIVERHLGDPEAVRRKIRQSRGGRFVSITITVRAESRRQLDELYDAFTSNDQILVAL